MSQEEGDRQTHLILYVGTHKLVGLEVRLEGGEPSVLAHSILKNPDGFEKGLVSNLLKASQSLVILVQSLLRGRSFEDLTCYVVLGNSKLKTYSTSSSQYYQGYQRVISPAEVRQVISQTRSVATLPLTEFVLQSIPQAFIVNDMEGVRNPIGLEAHRLGVSLKIHTMNFQDFRNLAKAFETAELEVLGYFPKTITVSDAVLSEDEKQEGALVFDISDGATTFVLWKDGAMADCRVEGFGGADLTAEIAQAWNIEMHDAARVKEQYASFETDFGFADELIPLVERNGSGLKTVRREDFLKKLQGHGLKWMENILAGSRKFTQEHGVQHPHFIFTGGGVSMPGFLEFLQTHFSVTGRIGLTRQMDAPSGLLMDPSLTAVLGLARWLSGGDREIQRYYSPQGFLEKTLASAKDWFETYF